MGCINGPQRIRSDMIKQSMKLSKPHIDQNALSRQLAVYGHQTQGKLMSMKVYIHGITGLGLQVAKNLILAGPKEVSIFDQTILTAHDLSNNFYAKQSQVGKVTRAEASLKQLQQLNPSATVKIATSCQVEYIVSNYSCVVVLDHFDRDYLIKLNKGCREKNIGFIYGGNLGLYGFTFVDFGDNHRVTDATGEQEKSIHVAGVTKDQAGVVYLHDQKRHGLNDGDTVVFREVKGMVQLNGKQFKIKVKSPDSFTIGDTSKFGDYVGGGIAHQTKMPTLLKFHSLQKSFSYPYPPQSKQMPICNWQKFGQPEQLHVILNGLLQFYHKHKRLPNNLDQKEAEQLSILSKQWLKNKVDKQGQQFKVQNLDQNLIKNVSLYSNIQLSPCCSYWGGIITQQIVKLTGKYTPLRQWLHHQFFELIPQKEVQRTLKNTRYIDYVTLFGDHFIKAIQSSRLFMVGAGALGCQFLKMFALMGIGSDGHGKIVCTDDDNIQISNLNRQFLFRKQYVGKNKSQTACSVSKAINPDCKFQSVKLKVGADTQDYFNDQFWTGIDFVVNAVDNIKARQYIDMQCVWYQKPMFQSGTLGTKCHSQIIIPHKTQSYTDIIDPPQETIPLCTLKNFPYQIQHTIQWARDYFQGAISQPSLQLRKFYQNRDKFLTDLLAQNKQNPSTARVKLQTVKRLYEANQSKSFEKCVQLSVNIFWDVFHNQIAQLLHAFPQDHIIEETKKPFWSGLKRAPIPIQLDLNDPLHVQVVQAAANIFAVIFNIHKEDNKNVIKSLVKNVKPVKFSPKKVKIDVDQKDKKNQTVQVNQQDENEVKKLSEILHKVPIDKKKTPTAVEFQKDDPSNWHIQFMGGVSNLRARNYKIQEVDNFRVKLIAGKIIPAIATTTAMIVGAVGIQILKYIQKKPIETFKNVTINLALPMWVFNDPLPPIQNVDKQFDPIMCGPIKAIPSKFTKWDKIDIKGPLTVQQLKNKLEKDYSVTVTMITYGTSTIFSSYGQDSQKRLKMKIPQAIESLTKKELPKWRTIVALGVSGNTSDGTDCIMPDIRYKF